ncbi:hypothetical protein [Sphingomonas oryzagri]
MSRRSSKGTAWTGREVRSLVRLYPIGGAKACRAEIPDHSLAAIKMAAHQLQVRRLAGQGVRSVAR